MLLSLTNYLLSFHNMLSAQVFKAVFDSAVIDLWKMFYTIDGVASQEITIKLKMHSVKRKIPPLKCKMFYTKITFRAFPLFTKILSSLTLSSLTPCLSQRKERVWLSKSRSKSYDLTILRSRLP